MNELKKQWLLKAYELATLSPDPSTQNGAIIISKSWEQINTINTDLIVGYACNTYPTGVKRNKERLERPLKYSIIEHAERGAIYQAAKDGKQTKDCTMFVPWFACADCARSIICSGIKNIIGHKQMMEKTPAHWKESIEIALTMLHESGINYELLDCKLNGPELLFNGTYWIP